jgi:hypothetical protein
VELAHGELSRPRFVGAVGADDVLHYFEAAFWFLFLKRADISDCSESCEKKVT